jgi:hypothetical protein
VRVPSLALAVAGAALLAPLLAPAAETHAAEHLKAPQEGEVSSSELLAKVRKCTRISEGRYRLDAGKPRTVPVCGTKDIVFWKADMDIDCDGRPGVRCNARTDPWFIPATAFTQSDGRYLKAEKLPFVVVPAPSRTWDYRASGIRGGSVAAVIHKDRVVYGVVGDVGPAEVIGEASYAAAKALGIDPDPRTGGTDEEVTYIVFRGSRVTPVEDRAAAVEQGEKLARKLVGPKKETPGGTTGTTAPTGPAGSVGSVGSAEVSGEAAAGTAEGTGQAKGPTEAASGQNDRGSASQAAGEPGGE